MGAVFLTRRRPAQALNRNPVQVFQLPPDLTASVLPEMYIALAAAARVTHSLMSMLPAPAASEAQAGGARSSLLQSMSDDERRWALLAGYLLPLRRSVYQVKKVGRQMSSVSPAWQGATL